jgi:hypothetical protein
MTQKRKSSAGTVIRRAIRVALRDVRVALPGQIVAYDATTRQADVQPLIMQAQPQSDGSTVTERLPVVTHCPVVFCGGGRSWLTFPIAVGDTCLLLFASSSLDRWLTVGGEVDPEDDRHHHLSDGIALVGMTDFAHPAPANAIATVLTGLDVRLGNEFAVDPVIKGSGFLTAFDTLIAAIGAAVGGIPGGAAAGTAIGTALTAFNAAATGFLSTIVKVGG